MNAATRTEALCAVLAYYEMLREDFDENLGPRRVNPVTYAEVEAHHRWMGETQERLDLWLSWLGWTRVEALDSLGQLVRERHREHAARGPR